MIFTRALFALCIISASAYANLTVQGGIGYREDQLDWSIAGFNDQPNILSELKWREVKSVEVSLEAAYSNNYNIYMRANGDIAGIFSGNNRDSDYHGNQRTEEFSRSYARSDGDYAYDASAGAGYLFGFLNNQAIIAPVVGYSVHGQHLCMHDGKLVISEFPGALGPIQGLDSTYTATWYGPWLGLDLSWAAIMGVRLWGAAEYHFARFDGSGHWNLRSDIIDNFTHEANGYGIVLKSGLAFPLTDCLELGLKGVFQTWRAEDGVDKVTALVETDNGSSAPLTFHTKFNAVNWQSWTASIFVQYFF